MQPPKAARVHQTSTTLYWFDSDLLYIVARKAPEPDDATLQRENEEFKRLLAGRRVCAVVDFTNASVTSQRIREHNSRELPALFKAMAFIIRNPFSRMMANLFLGVKSISFPVKMCSSQKEAEEWIRKYLD